MAEHLSPAVDLRHVVTERLELRALIPADTDEVFALHADPRVWTHYPVGRHRDRGRSEKLVADAERGWQHDGLAHWSVRARADAEGAHRPLLGVAGVARRPGPLWNLYYRFSPVAQGHGYAREVAAVALAAAARIDASLPVVAYLLEHNVASRTTAERVGLQQVWRGPDHGNPDPDAVRLVYADRPLPPDLLEALVARA